MGEIRAAVTRMSSVGHVLLQINKNKSEEISTLEQRRKKIEKLLKEEAKKK